MRTTLAAALLTAAAAAAAMPAQAAVITHTALGTWTAAAGAPTLSEDFSGFAVDTSFRAAPVAIGLGTIAQVGSARDFRNQIDVVPLIFTDNNGTNHASMFVEGDEGLGVLLVFSQAVSAFGAEFFDSATSEGVVLELLDSSASLIATTGTVPSTGFFGFTTDAGEQISSVRFRAATSNGTQGGEGFGMDNLVAVAASTTVPEPASIALLGAGLLGLRLARRRV